MKPPETRSAKTAEWNIAYQVLGSGPRVGLRKRSSSERGSEDAVLEQVEEKLRAMKPRIGKR